jgi:hypothetical protein
MGQQRSQPRASWPVIGATIPKILFFGVLSAIFMET